MNLITVIPLTRSKVAETLSYFTASEIPRGAMVSVPLRSKSIHAIVAGSKPVEDMKTEIKSAEFAIRKLGKVKTSAFFPVSFMDACAALSDYYVSTPGAVIETLMAKAILEGAGSVAPPMPAQSSFIDAPAPPTSSDGVYAVQGDDADRISSWRSLIRQEFAKKRSVAFYVPTIEEAEQLEGALTKGIEGYIFSLNSSLPPKKLAETWNKIAAADHPVVVIATASFAVLPRSDIDAVVIERENGRGWRTLHSPYMDLRHALETVARKSRRTLYRADSLLSAETLHRLNREEIAQGSPFKWRSVSTARDRLVDMVSASPEKKSPADKESAAEKKAFRVISPELEELIGRNREESTHLFVYAVRRGLATATVCDDCDTLVACGDCNAPMVLHSSRETDRNFFMCHVCGTRRNAEETCKNCGGWRLSPLGIGTERVEAEIKTIFPDADVFRIDADIAKTDKQISTVLQKWRGRPGSVLVGGDAALSHIRDKADHVAVASLDSLFALPDFRIPEKIMYTLIRLRSISSRSVLVQTRRPGEKVFEYGLKGNLSDFHREEIAERKRLNYPPFASLLKISIEGRKDPIARSMAAVQKLVEPLEMDIFPAFTASARGNSVIHGLIRIGANEWPNLELARKLRSLPPKVTIRIDPESLL